MRKIKISTSLISLFLICAVVANIIACGFNVHGEDLTEGITPNAVTVPEDAADHSREAVDFSMRLLEANFAEGENVLLSPLSVLNALAMTMNGAEGETLRQMEDTFGIGRGELNTYLYSCRSGLVSGEKSKLHLANSIWFSDDDTFEVNRDFLQTCCDYYGADIYRLPFDDTAVREINGWVKSNTDGMIPEILDNISKDAIMYLINALSFEAEWGETYAKTDIKPGIFTKEDGSTQEVEYMHGTESIYLGGDQVRGFMKPYSDGRYAFAALLPDEGVPLAECIEALDGNSLYEILQGREESSVSVSIPKFEADYTAELSATLGEMGMTDLFDEYSANLSGIGDAGTNIYVSRVLHKTFISVGEKGTRAGAATAVEAGKLALDYAEENRVYLNRPFIYMIVDCENNVPIFIGAMNDING